ncbi:MAG: hypothetical protein Q7S02_03335 [bacterium]|nr:hypothetical protein [bacterium]
MDHDDRFELANRIVETTIRELYGPLRTGRPLEQFYHDIREGKTRAFVALRVDPEDFVGLLFDAAGAQCRFELWLNLESRDEGPPWCILMYAEHRTPDVQFTHRSPKNPITLAQSMGLLDGVPPNEDDASEDT